MRLLLAILVLACPAAAPAQPAYPTKPIRMVVATPSRTAIDNTARIVARALAEGFGQPIVVDNRGAGNGVAAGELVASAQPDGHTLLVQSTAFVTLPLLYKLPYDNERDLVPVSRIASSSLVLVVHPQLAARTAAELVALARQKPGSLNYASYGAGSLAQLAGDLFRGMAALKLSAALHPGVPEAMGAVMSGSAQMMFAEIGYALPHVESNALRALATTGRARSALMSGLPTLAESGVKGYEFVLWLGAFAPAGTPGPVVERVAAEIARVLEAPGIERQLAAQGLEPSPLPPGEFQRYVRAESQKFAVLVRK